LLDEGIIEPQYVAPRDLKDSVELHKNLLSILLSIEGLRFDCEICSI